MTAAQDRLAKSPRRLCRYTYLANVWPDLDPTMDPSEAILTAPAEMIVEAMAVDLERYNQILDEARDAVDHADERLDELQAAVRLFLAQAPANLLELLDARTS